MYVCYLLEVISRSCDMQQRQQWLSLKVKKMWITILCIWPAVCALETTVSTVEWLLSPYPNMNTSVYIWIWESLDNECTHTISTRGDLAFVRVAIVVSIYLAERPNQNNHMGSFVLISLLHIHFFRYSSSSENTISELPRYSSWAQCRVHFYVLL